MMINIGGFESTLKTIPCSYNFARIWICQHRLQRGVYLSTPKKFFVTCCKHCIMISRHCYKICYVKAARKNTFPRQRRQHHYTTKMSDLLLNLQPEGAFRVVILNRQHDVTEKSGDVCEFESTTSINKYNVLTNTTFKKHFFWLGLVTRRQIHAQTVNIVVWMDHAFCPYYCAFLIQPVILANACVFHMAGK